MKLNRLFEEVLKEGNRFKVPLSEDIYDKEINDIVDSYIENHSFSPDQKEIWDELNEFR